jgi:hypothetical protein
LRCAAGIRAGSRRCVGPGHRLWLWYWYWLWLWLWLWYWLWLCGCGSRALCGWLCVDVWMSLLQEALLFQGARPGQAPDGTVRTWLLATCGDVRLCGTAVLSDVCVFVCVCVCVCVYLCLCVCVASPGCLRSAVVPHLTK